MWAWFAAFYADSLDRRGAGHVVGHGVDGEGLQTGGAQTGPGDEFGQRGETAVETGGERAVGGEGAEGVEAETAAEFVWAEFVAFYC